jgi:uncharacterized protein
MPIASEASTFTASHEPSSPTDADAIVEAIEHAAHLLPSQGPITAFVHHNTLHAFEDLEFDTAVRKGAAFFKTKPYLAEKEFRAFMVSGRIRPEDIDAVLWQQLGERAEDMLGFLGTRFSLYRAILNYSLHDGPSVDIKWVVGDSNALNRFRDDAPEKVKEQFVSSTKQWIMRDLRIHNGNVNSSARSQIDGPLLEKIDSILQSFDSKKIETWTTQKWESFTLHILWEICAHGIRTVKTRPFDAPEEIRFRDSLLKLTGKDSDELVHDILIPYCSAFIDQGFSTWPMKDRDEGFFVGFCKMYGRGPSITAPWRRPLANELSRILNEGESAVDSILGSLADMGVAPNKRDAFICQSLLALRGFAGMIWQLETRGDRVSRPVQPGSLLQFLAIRLILDRFAVKHIAATEGYDGELSELMPWISGRLANRTGKHKSTARDIYRIFELAQLLDWRPETLAKNSKAQWQKLVDELTKFTEVDRRFIYHLAYERKYRNQTLDAITHHSRRTFRHQEIVKPARPDFQIVNCIDEREESFRRHLEEIYPNCETFGAAGFFATAMYYRGAADAHFTPLCPVVIKPDHYVREQVVYSLQKHDEKRRRARRTIGTVTHQVHIGSRTFTGGWIGTAMLGSLATFPLVARTLFPRITARFRKMIGGFVKSPELTELVLERRAQVPPGPNKEQLGFSVEEMGDIVERLLRDISLTDSFAKLCFICGHGSASLNNPHESAHDCGACAGGRGGPNARAFAQMANDKRVRNIVAGRSIVIPDETVFVGCYHNTCDDNVTYYDLDRIPVTHQLEFERAAKAIDEARRRDAHERCRRFESAPLNLSFADALKHVEGRAEDLSQVRPEYGHATNALCFVGRRQWSRSMFLDRRAFLQSYDPSQDDQRSSILERILQAVIPVCAGINLEYYFSFVDPEGYGCGTKLPHNITSLLGVMNGAGSDLRPGLPWQMVEIHEPVRLLLVIETTPTAMKRIIADNEPIKKLCEGAWVQLALLDADKSEIKLYQDGEFINYRPESDSLDCVSNSVDWYRGWRDHLKFASVGPVCAGNR